MPPPIVYSRTFGDFRVPRSCVCAPGMFWERMQTELVSAGPQRWLFAALGPPAAWNQFMMILAAWLVVTDAKSGPRYS